MLSSPDLGVPGEERGLPGHGGELQPGEAELPRALPGQLDAHTRQLAARGATLASYRRPQTDRLRVPGGVARGGADDEHLPCRPHDQPRARLADGYSIIYTGYRIIIPGRRAPCHEAAARRSARGRCWSRGERVQPMSAYHRWPASSSWLSSLSLSLLSSSSL